MKYPHISVCICTYRRPQWLRRLLLALERQQTGGQFTYSVVVADNDASESARAGVTEFAASSSVRVTYCVEPAKNIALVRNRALAAADGDWIAFIDDDEFPIENWLALLFQSCARYKAQGVLGPVRPHYDETPPSWVAKCGLYDRPEYSTGYIVTWPESRTGNVLFRRDILPDNTPAFDERFGNGGEDQDFFRRMMARGASFVWCNEAVVHETVPPIRWDRKVMIRRALLRGRNTLKHSRNGPVELTKSVVAVVVYGVALPVLALLAPHLYIRYLIKTCDHLGKILAAVGLNRITERAG